MLPADTTARSPIDETGRKTHVKGYDDETANMAGI